MSPDNTNQTDTAFKNVVFTVGDPTTVIGSLPASDVTVAVKIGGDDAASPDQIQALKDAGYKIVIWQSGANDEGVAAVGQYGASGYIAQAEGPGQLEAAQNVSAQVTVPKALVTNVYMGNGQWPPGWIAMPEAYQNADPSATPSAVIDRANAAGATEVIPIFGAYDGSSENADGAKVPLQTYLNELRNSGVSNFGVYPFYSLTDEEKQQLTAWAQSQSTTGAYGQPQPPDAGSSVLLQSHTQDAGATWDTKDTSTLDQKYGASVSQHGSVLAARPNADGTKEILQMSDGSYQTVDKTTGAYVGGAGTWGDGAGGGVGAGSGVGNPGSSQPGSNTMSTLSLKTEPGVTSVSPASTYAPDQVAAVGATHGNDMMATAPSSPSPPAAPPIMAPTTPDAVARYETENSSPPAYTGGAEPVKVEHLNNGGTLTTTATGAEIEQVPGHSAYQVKAPDPVPAASAPVIMAPTTPDAVARYVAANSAPAPTPASSPDPAIQNAVNSAAASYAETANAKSNDMMAPAITLPAATPADTPPPYVPPPVGHGRTLD